MSYKKHYEQASKAGSFKIVSLSIIEWTKEGDYVLGKLESIEEFTGGDFDQSCNCYIFDTDEGRVSCVLGSAADKSFQGLDLIGQVLHVEYQGKGKGKTGREYNMFNITQIM